MRVSNTGAKPRMVKVFLSGIARDGNDHNTVQSVSGSIYPGNQRVTLLLVSLDTNCSVSDTSGCHIERRPSTFD